MRKLFAWVFMYSLDGLLADEGTELLAVLLRLAPSPGGPEAEDRPLRERVRAHHGGPPLGYEQSMEAPADILTELIRQSVGRPRNVPAGDLGESLVARAFCGRRRHRRVVSRPYRFGPAAGKPASRAATTGRSTAWKPSLSTTASRCLRLVSGSSRRPPTRRATPSGRHSAPATASSTPQPPTATSARSARRCTAPAWIGRGCSLRPRSGSATASRRAPASSESTRSTC